ncbi:cyclic nucleotide-binding domain-containing protein [Sphingomonas aliaeris]|uniref:Cyclic nucleotide-binding domain-containing protein n=1 Tax=Sphingomonas aliaeris TaxID=2759526 RepID=A0A974NVW2_9SPHN|nr:cyclic nucleotide-binding domain-containing protein [Sphingomonas aliaeris]QQV78019.1 cyclic nucleotide-binding domain-containing protein [Sphingomonas aliaeris]
MGLFLDRLSSHNFVANDDRAAFMGLRALSRYHEPAKYLQREGDLNSEMFFVIAERHAFGQKIAEDGKRQIVSLLMPGDTSDGHKLFLRLTDHNVQALTRLQTVEISRADVQRVAFERPRDRPCAMDGRFEEGGGHAGMAGQRSLSARPTSFCTPTL